MKTFPFLTFVLAAFMLVVGCHKRTYQCPPDTYYRFQDLKIYKIFSKNGLQTHEFYSSSGLATDTLTKTDSLKMALLIDVEFYSNNEFNRINNFSFFPAAYAYMNPCPDGTKGTKESISNINITSSEDFDAKHLSNQSLNDLFFVKEIQNENFDIPINDFLTQLYANPQEASYTSVRRYFEILLKSKPSMSAKHEFKISIEYSDGRRFVARSPEILFL